MNAIRFTVRVLACCLAAASVASAQTVDLGLSAGRRVVEGAVAGARTGASLVAGDVTGDFWNRELVVGTPDEAAGRGAVRVFIARPQAPPSTTAAADAVLSGGAAGDRFGAAVDAGYVTHQEIQVVDGRPVGATPPRDIVVGAPGAQGGRGVVYVFAGPLGGGETLAPADAEFTILGAAPGDNLGTVIETADLNGDRYREVILAIPSRGIVYVIDLKAAATTTVDLAVSPPSTSISGLSGEIVLATGDITSDGAFDLAIGDPNAQSGRGAVYLVRARAGSLPATLTLPAQADAQVFGIDVGDRFGASLWIADIDASRPFAGELIIGAPGGDGPSNARPDAGEVSVIWGRIDITAAFRPGLTLFGAGIAHRLGTKVTAGDVTRDLPDDLVMLAPGANGGSGELFVYFGRDRSSFPREPIDLATSASRRVIGDEAAGPIGAACVWEMTGEGAEEVVVGAPNATTTAGAQAGRLYVALSPRFDPSVGTVLLRAMQGNSHSALLTVGNPSAVAVNFSAASTVPWLAVGPSAASTVVGTPALLTVTGSAASLGPGEYSATLNLSSTSPDLTMILEVPVTLRVLAQPRLTASVIGSVQHGQAVTWTATADTSEGPVEYMFRRYTTSGGWTTVQNYSPSNTFTWTPAASETGQYVLEVWVRPVGSSSAFETQTNTGYFAVGDAAPIVALSHKVDFDGDGRVDLSVFRPSNGTWYALLSSAQFNASLVRRWGLGTDLPVPGDYDGDGRTDMAVYRPSTGYWYVLQSSTQYGTSALYQWGISTDLPVPADYDGDGRTDIAVYRPSTGYWYVLQSSTQYRTSALYRWGIGTDLPMPGDYDGDGRADIAVYRPSNGYWYVLQSSTQYGTSIVRQWGISTDLPVPGDYDGDGRTDIAVYRRSTGYWYVLQSSTRYGTSAVQQWGISTDFPVPGDYDGDGRTDIAVYRPAPSSMWYVWNRFSRVWGTAGDVPLLRK